MLEMKQHKLQTTGSISANPQPRLETLTPRALYSPSDAAVLSPRPYTASREQGTLYVQEQDKPARTTSIGTAYHASSTTARDTDMVDLSEEESFQLFLDWEIPDDDMLSIGVSFDKGEEMANNSPTMSGRCLIGRQSRESESHQAQGWDDEISDEDLIDAFCPVSQQVLPMSAFLVDPARGKSLDQEDDEWCKDDDLDLTAFEALP